MTIKEAILNSLEELKALANSIEICDHILKNKLYEFAGKTPAATVSAQLGDFIRNGDTRVKRVKAEGGNYRYYLAKHEQLLGLDMLTEEPSGAPKTTQSNKAKTYDERDLHKLLSSFLKNEDTYSKTIYHEKSTASDNNQIWTHPDMVGIKFLNLQSRTCQNFLRSFNKVDTFKISSYELKKEINSDSELKKAYFQAVSNSSWANYGYLVAFEFNDSLKDEMTRLNQAFGIGIIELNPNPYQSKVLFPAAYKELDVKTMDKLCKMNKDFDRFVEQTEKLLTANEKYATGAEKELQEFCDSYFINDSEIEAYCKDRNIPMKD